MDSLDAGNDAQYRVVSFLFLLMKLSREHWDPADWSGQPGEATASLQWGLMPEVRADDASQAPALGAAQAHTKAAVSSQPAFPTTF